jgi:hypothetical protein
MLRGVGTKGEDVLWLSEDPVSGSVPASDSTEVTVTFDPAGLFPGEYQATLSILNPPHSPVQVAVTLHVEWRKLFLPMMVK